jgi:hypothetical protein
LSPPHIRDLESWISGQGCRAECNSAQERPWLEALKGEEKERMKERKDGRTLCSPLWMKLLQRRSKALTQIRSPALCQRPLLSMASTACRFPRYGERYVLLVRQGDKSAKSPSDTLLALPRTIAVCSDIEPGTSPAPLPLCREPQHPTFRSGSSVSQGQVNRKDYRYRLPTTQRRFASEEVSEQRNELQ